jgi:hypothetical protein
MTQPNSRVYRVALSYQSDRPFAELLAENISTARYAHSTKRSKAVSVPHAFITLLSSLFRNNTNDKIRAERAASGETVEAKFDSMHELYIAMAVGNYHIPTQTWQKFLNQVCTAIGYSDQPTTIESKLCYAAVCENYEDSNPYLSAAIRAAQEAIYDARVNPAPADTDAPAVDASTTTDPANTGNEATANEAAA